MPSQRQIGRLDRLHGGSRRKHRESRGHADGQAGSDIRLPIVTAAASVTAAALARDAHVGCRGEHLDRHVAGLNGGQAHAEGEKSPQEQGEYPT